MVANYTAGPKEFFDICMVCFFLGIKYMEDVFKWFVEDFSAISNLSASTILRLEKHVIRKLLGYKLFIEESEYLEAHAKFYRNVDRRKLSKNSKSTKITRI